MLPRLTVLFVLSAASSPCPDYVNPLYEQISTAQGPAEYARSLDERSSVVSFHKRLVRIFSADCCISIEKDRLKLGFQVSDDLSCYFKLF
ncbi:hypothetical protein HMPREF3156_00714 [Neisseria sp. HMSC06F02]|nr:hypothetical protein HMPREF3156_00714 [Neisseria sp. HMSC06F02]